MSPSVEMATSPAEEAALERAATLPVGEAASVGGGAVLAGPIYSAASGRRCRQLTIGPRHRLACEDRESDVWVFVPNVFSDRGAAEESVGTADDAASPADPGGTS